MALAVDIDIADAYVSQEAFSVLDGLIRQRDLGAFQVSNIWAIDDIAMTLMPVQMTAAWASAAGKYQLTDWALDNAKWEQVAHRAANDYFMNSRGLPAAAAIASTHQFAANAGICFEFVALSSAHAIVRDLYIIEFGGCFKLHVHSDGTADFEDTRPQSASQPLLRVGAPLTSSSQDLSGKFCRIIILPWRRGRIYVTTSQGGAFEVYVGERQDVSSGLAGARTTGETVYHVTTEAAAPKVTPTTLCRAFWALSQVQYPSTGSLRSPVVTLPTPVSTSPSTSAVDAETQDSTTATLTLKDQSGATFNPTTLNPATSLQFSIALATPTPTVAPVIFRVQIEFDRSLSNRTYGTNTVTVTEAHLSMSRERSSKSFSFRVDNPHDTFTSIKDLWNRRVKAYLTVDTVDLVATSLFEGYADPTEFVDGRASSLTINVSGLRKRLRYSLMSDAREFDGWLHTDMVKQVLHDAGIDDAHMYIYPDPGVTLEKADPGDDPIWKPANGASRDEWIQHCCDVFSGWVFDDIGGVFYYCPREFWTAAAVLDTSTVPQILVTTPTDPITHQPTSMRAYPSYLVATEIRQRADEPKANDIWVLGKDSKTDQIIAAHYVDNDSINTRTAVNWVGERRVMVYASAAITTLAAATRALGIIAGRVTQAIRTVDFVLPDYRWSELPLEGPAYLQNYGLGIITSFEADLSRDRSRTTSYTMELL